MEYAESEEEGAADASEAAAGRAKSRLHTLVAVTVALIATFMAICSVKSGNIAQAMEQDQAELIDNWGFYQARNIRQTVYEATADQLKLAAASAPASTRNAYKKKIAEYEQWAADQDEKKKEPMAKAQKAAEDYRARNVHDDQFDLSDAMLALAIALLATTSLTQKRWMYIVAMVPTLIGVIYGLAGLLGWGISSGVASRWLGS
jgi:hypothetical protein